MAETLDFTRPLSELMDTHPSLKEDLHELDIEVEDPTETIPQLAKRLDVGLPIIAMALEASGYTVEGYDPKEDEGAADSPLPDLIAALFGVDRNGNPLPDPDFSQESLCATELGHEPAPVLLHMEDAIRHAQQEGILPKDAGKKGCGCQKNA